MAAATSQHDPMKNRPAANRAARSAVFNPAGRRDNYEKSLCQITNADRGQQVQ